MPATGNSGGVTEFGVLSPGLVAQRKAITAKAEEIAKATTVAEQQRLLKEASAQLALYEQDPLVLIDPEAARLAQQARTLFESASFQEGLDAASLEAGIKAGTEAISRLTGGGSAKDFFQQEEIADALSGNRPVDGSVIPSGPDLQLRVETFLVNLYSALDTDHQQFEKAIRGELLPQGNINPDQVRFEGEFAPTPQAPFSPPFNAPNRALGGDPAAIAQTAKSSIGDLKKTWSAFGDKLNANTQRTKLEGEIRKDVAKISRLEAQKADAQNFLSGNAHGPFPGDPQKQIDDLNKEISRLQQDVAKKQNEAARLPT